MSKKSKASKERMRQRWDLTAAPATEGLVGQQQVEGVAAGVAAAMEVVVDGAAADFERAAQALAEPGKNLFLFKKKLTSRNINI